jgi:hypothetical protein
MADIEIEFIKKLVPSLNSITDNDGYLMNRFKAYRNFMEQSEVPAEYIYTILENPMSVSVAMKQEDVREFFNNVSGFLDNEFNCIFRFRDERECIKSAEKVSAFIIQNYIKHYLASNEYMKRMLYIDTVSLMDDLKRVINYSMSSETSIKRTFNHNYETLSNGIENYDFVIWNSLMSLKTDYEKEELNRILTVRHKKGLSNLFMVYGDNGSICEKLGIAHRMLTGCGVVDI